MEGMATKKTYAAPSVVKRTVVSQTLGLPGGAGEPISGHENEGGF
jgi:hypothetical protein